MKGCRACPPPSPPCGPTCLPKQNPNADHLPLSLRLGVPGASLPSPGSKGVLFWGLVHAAASTILQAAAFLASPAWWVLTGLCKRLTAGAGQPSRPTLTLTTSDLRSIHTVCLSQTSMKRGDTSAWAARDLAERLESCPGRAGSGEGLPSAVPACEPPPLVVAGGRSVAWSHGGRPGCPSICSPSGGRFCLPPNSGSFPPLFLQISFPAPPSSAWEWACAHVNPPMAPPPACEPSSVCRYSLTCTFRYAVPITHSHH